MPFTWAISQTTFLYTNLIGEQFFPMSIGLVPKPATRTEGACASSALAFREGVFAIASGFYDVVLVGGVEDMSKRSTEEVAEGLALAASPYERKAGLTFPGVFAVIATAYFEKYGASREHLMNVTIKSHDNAPLNPKAQFNLAIRDMMDAKVKRAKSQGKAVPDWIDEKDFLRRREGKSSHCLAHASL